MKVLRKLLGILVMIAGILGLLLAIAGLVGVWWARPLVASGVESTIATLNTSIDTSRQTMVVTEQALQGTIDSVVALQTMLDATASSVTDTMPLVSQITTFLGDNLPATLNAAASSLKSAQEGATVLDQAIRSFDTFKAVLSAVPFFGSAIPQSGPAYNPEKPLAESLGDVATELEGLPDKFIEMSKSMDKTDDNMVTIQTSLSTMATSVSSISASLEQYRAMVANSQSSMDNLQKTLQNLQANLSSILNTVALGVSLLLVWLLFAQIVILSQGYELFMGTAGRMEGGAAQPAETKAVPPPAVVSAAAPVEAAAAETAAVLDEAGPAMAESAPQVPAELPVEPTGEPPAGEGAGIEPPPSE